MSADNVVEVAVKATIAQLTSGMKEASASVDMATKGMGDSFQVLAEKTIAYQNVNTALKNTLGAMAKGELPIVTSTMRTLAEQQQATAVAARELAAAEAEVKTEMEGVAAAVEHTVPQYAAASAAVRTLDGNLSIRAAERFLTTTLGIGNALQVAFPLFGALALTQVIATMADKLSQAAANLFLFTQRERELLALNESANKKILDAENQRAQAEEEHFKNTHNGVQNAIHDLALNKAAHDNIKTALDKEQDTLKTARTVLAANAQMAVLMNQITTASTSEMAKKATNDYNAIAAAVKRTGMSVEDAKKSVDNMSVAAGVHEKQLKATDATAKVLADHLTDAFSKASEAAQKDADKTRALEAKLYADLQNRSDKYFEDLQKQKEKQEREDDALLAEQRAHAAELEREFREAQLRKRKALDDSIQDGVAEIEGERRTAQEKIAILQQQLATAHSQKLIGDKEAVDAEKALVKALYDIDKAALDAKILLLQKDPEKNHKEIVKSNAELVTLEQKLQLDLNKATDKGVAERMQKYHQAFSQLEGSFSSSIKGMVAGTETLGDAVKNMASGVVDQFIDMLSKMLFTWIEKHVLMLVFGKTTNAQEIAANAALAASAAYASVAAVPLVGWAMAPAVGAAAYSEVMAMQGLNAFAQGGIVAGDQVAKVHDEEMILPQHLSRGLQDMFSAGSSGGAGGGDVHLHYSPSVNAIDAKGMDSVLMKHSKSLVKVVRREVKAGRLK